MAILLINFFRNLRDFQQILRICFKKFNTNSDKICNLLVLNEKFLLIFKFFCKDIEHVDTRKKLIRILGL